MKFLANHFFNANELQLAESLCKRAMSFLMRIKRPEEQHMKYYK